MNDTSNRVIAVIVVVILLIGAWYVGRTQGSSVGAVMAGDSALMNLGTSSNSDMTDTSSDATMSGTSASVADQAAGKTVAISSVTLPKIGWVAIRDKNGRVLGAGRFEAGTNKSVQVSLLRTTVGGEHYDVVLYIDDGDKAFDLHKDMVVKTAAGSDVAATFSAK